MCLSPRRNRRGFLAKEHIRRCTKGLAPYSHLYVCNILLITFIVQVNKGEHKACVNYQVYISSYVSNVSWSRIDRYDCNSTKYQVNTFYEWFQHVE